MARKHFQMVYPEEFSTYTKENYGNKEDALRELTDLPVRENDNPNLFRKLRITKTGERKVLMYNGEELAEYSEGWFSSRWVFMEGKEAVRNAFEKALGLKPEEQTRDSEIKDALKELEKSKIQKDVPALYEQLSIDGVFTLQK